MTAAGEWLPEWMRSGVVIPIRRDVDEHQADDDRPAVWRQGLAVPAWVADQLDEHQADVDGAGAPPPAPAPSLVSGAIGRALADARESYRQQLVDQWHEVGAEGPTVHACTVAGLGQEGQEGRSPQ